MVCRREFKHVNHVQGYQYQLNRSRPGPKCDSSSISRTSIRGDRRLLSLRETFNKVDDLFFRYARRCSWGHSLPIPFILSLKMAVPNKLAPQYTFLRVVMIYKVWICQERWSYSSRQAEENRDLMTTWLRQVIPSAVFALERRLRKDDSVEREYLKTVATPVVAASGARSDPNNLDPSRKVLIMLE